MARPKGIDVSNNNDMVDWPLFKGIDFAFIKATESNNFDDPLFQYNWAHAKSIGAHRWAYHFAHPLVDPVVQADFFSNQVDRAGLAHGDNFAVDIEITQGFGPEYINNWTHRFLSHMKEIHPAHRVIVYTYPFFVNPGMLTSAEDYYLWIADYGVAEPLVPKPWKDWTFWQYYSPAVSTPVRVDLNVFNGTKAELNKFCTTTGHFRD